MTWRIDFLVEWRRKFWFFKLITEVYKTCSFTQTLSALLNYFRFVLYKHAVLRSSTLDDSHHKRKRNIYHICNCICIINYILNKRTCDLKRYWLKTESSAYTISCSLFGGIVHSLAYGYMYFRLCFSAFTRYLAPLALGCIPISLALSPSSITAQL